MLALTHIPSPNLEQCQRTFIAPAPIDFGRALKQHETYCAMLRRCGADVRTLTVNRDFPDSVFIEDTAVVLDEVAVVCSMGAISRRGELAGAEPELRKHRAVQRIELPATIEGGDVLRVGRRLLVGLSARTNESGCAGLAAIAGRFGYEVVAVPVRHCLHLKSACAPLPDGRLLVNPAWLDATALKEFDLVSILDAEPDAANVLLLDDRVCLSAAHPRTAEMLQGLRFNVEIIDVSEFAKAEGCVTCLSILIT